MGNNDDALSVVHELIETCRDGETGYLHASATVTDPQLKAHFQKQSQERHSFIEELKQEAARLGEKETDTSGSTAGMLHRIWFETKADLGLGDAAVLSSVDSGEESAKKTYEKALEAPLPDDLRVLVNKQAQCVFDAHNRVLVLRENKAA